MINYDKNIFIKGYKAANRLRARVEGCHLWRKYNFKKHPSTRRAEVQPSTDYLDLSINRLRAEKKKMGKNYKAHMRRQIIR